MTTVEKLMNVLKDGKYHTAQELINRVSHRFSDAVYKARKKGYEIEIKQISFNQFEYRLSNKSLKQMNLLECKSLFD